MAAHALLNSRDHADLRVRVDRSPELGDAVMACLTVPDEFRRVAADHPILFRLDEERTGFTALALFGFEAGENLFLEDGRWDAGYVPLAMAAQPFLIGPPAPGSTEPQVHVDLDSPRIAPDGVRIFDEDGRPTPYLEEVAGKLGELDQGYRRSGAFFEALRRHGLLEPLALEVTLDDGSTNRLVGYHVVDEDAVRSLDAEALGELHADDHLLPMFMAMASLGRLPSLIARKNKRVAGG